MSLTFTLMSKLKFHSLSADFEVFRFRARTRRVLRKKGETMMEIELESGITSSKSSLEWNKKDEIDTSLFFHFYEISLINFCWQNNFNLSTLSRASHFKTSSDLVNFTENKNMKAPRSDSR